MKLNETEIQKSIRKCRKVIRDVPSMILYVAVHVCNSSSAQDIPEESVTVTDLYTPYNLSDHLHLSIVVVGRNDRWGGHQFVDRLQLFINFTTALACEVGSERAELVLVEWNPLETEARLTEILVWPRSVAFPIVKSPARVPEPACEPHTILARRLL
jgi:hypothetical protein